MVSDDSLGTILEALARALDIPDDLADEAILRYESVAAWLSEEGSPLLRFSPEIYPQGSFRLGTPVRPMLRGEEFDIDLVCRLAIPKEDTTQAELKDRVGKRLKEDKSCEAIVQAKRRCWTLVYSKKFHLDVLPAIPDAAALATCILLTDRDLREWQPSNPIGYAKWFFGQMETTLREAREALAKAASLSVEEIPEWRARTPLQRSVQILKRHRDGYFDARDENRPVSIILTTLAARAYDGERHVYRAVRKIVQNMPRHIERRGDKWWVPNPAQPAENFADKWNETPERREAFLQWLLVVQRDLSDAPNFPSVGAARDLLEERLGFHRSPAATPLAVSAAPALAASEHRLEPHWPEVISHRCSVRGFVHPGHKRGRALWRMTDRALPKGVGLRFEAITNVQRPYEVHWQVVNTGQEATAAQQLRGGFDPSEVGKTGIRWERTAFAGTHWIEAFVVKDDVCVARSGRTLVRVRT